MKSRTIKHFRIIGMAEGISYLLLLAVAMPMKYYAGMPEAVKYTGWIHGILFILYMVYLFRVEAQQKWSISEVLWGGIASLLPFGTFVLDKKLKKEQNLAEELELSVK